MTAVTDVPPFAALLIAILAVCGALVTLIGSIGLLRLETFYDRLHPPTMGSTAGMALVLAASMILFSVLDARPVIHEILIAVLVTMTTPVTFVLLVRAALHRDTAEGRDPTRE